MCSGRPGRRVEGQVRGLQQIVEDGRYCIDVLIQISVATKAVQNVAVGLLDDDHRVAGAVVHPEAQRQTRS